MFKDPLHTEETPYEILDLAFNASLKEIQSALSKFMADPRKRSKLPKAQEALKKLKNVKTRIEIDIMHYCIDQTDFNPNKIDLSRILDEFCAIPELKYEDLFSDVKKESFEDEYADIQERKIKTSKLKKYDNPESCKLEDSFLFFDL